ncbi:hypothetical protein BVX97_01410 [bacterium E08(2017)]|nr:hypothetical protein BVX97_01410 [bacterium E08(2017)]
MSTISFNCPGCQQPIEAPEEMAGQAAACPTCSQQITIPNSTPEAPAAAPPAASGNACPSCSAPMEAGAVLCIQCGFHTGMGKKIDTTL